MRKTFVGVDPGKTGAIVVLTVGKEIKVETHKVPLFGTKEYNIHEYINILHGIKKQDAEALVVLEDVHAIFGKGAGSTFEFGKGAGIAETAVVAANLSFVKVQPKVWQKVALQGVKVMYKGKTASGKDKVDTKGMALVAATRLFPNVRMNFGGKAVNAHDGLVDALLMAYYGSVSKS